MQCFSTKKPLFLSHKACVWWHILVQLLALLPVLAVLLPLVHATFSRVLWVELHIPIQYLHFGGQLLTQNSNCGFWQKQFPEQSLVSFSLQMLRKFQQRNWSFMMCMNCRQGVWRKEGKCYIYKLFYKKIYKLLSDYW